MNFKITMINGEKITVELMTDSAAKTAESIIKSSCLQLENNRVAYNARQILKIEY